MKKLELVDNHYCFACGMENPEGLRIEIVLNEGEFFIVPKGIDHLPYIVENPEWL